MTSEGLGRFHFNGTVVLGYCLSVNVFQLPSSWMKELHKWNTGRLWLLVTNPLMLTNLCTCSCFPHLGHKNETATARFLPVCHIITPPLFYSHSAFLWINEVLTLSWTQSSSSFHSPTETPPTSLCTSPSETPCVIIASSAGKMNKLLNSRSGRRICKLHQPLSPAPFIP